MRSRVIRRRFRKTGLSYARKRLTYGRKRARTSRFAKAVKNVILKTAEPKHRNVFLTEVLGNVEGAEDPIPDPTRYQLFHNGISYVGLMNNNVPDNNKYPFPVRGVGDTDRVGDEIRSIGMRVNMVIDVNNQFRSTKFKLMLVEWNSSGGNPWAYSNLFETTTGLIPLDKINNDKFKCTNLGTYYVRPHDMQGAETTGIQISKWIPFKRRLKFGDNTQKVNVGTKEQMGILILPFNSVAESEVLFPNPHIANFVATATLHWKDP